MTTRIRKHDFRTEAQRRREAFETVAAAILNDGKSVETIDASLQMAILGGWDAPDQIEYYGFQLDALDDITTAVKM